MVDSTQPQLVQLSSLFPQHYLAYLQTAPMHLPIQFSHGGMTQAYFNRVAVSTAPVSTRPLGFPGHHHAPYRATLLTQPVPGSVARSLQYSGTRAASEHTVFAPGFDFTSHREGRLCAYVVSLSTGSGS